MGQVAATAWVQFLLGVVLVAGGFYDVPFHLGAGAVLTGISAVALVTEYHRQWRDARRDRETRAMVARAMEANTQAALVRAAEAATTTQGH